MDPRRYRYPVRTLIHIYLLVDLFDLFLVFLFTRLRASWLLLGFENKLPECELDIVEDGSEGGVDVVEVGEEHLHPSVVLGAVFIGLQINIPEHYFDYYY